MLVDKVNVLVTLRNAYWHLSMMEQDAADIIEEAFHKVRRSLQSVVFDTNPKNMLVRLQTPVLSDKAEGYNGRMPRHF